MTTKEIRKEANSVIKDLFHITIKSNNKDYRKKALDFILENSHKKNRICAEDRHIWNCVKMIMFNKYGKKFILNKVDLHI